MSLLLAALLSSPAMTPDFVPYFPEKMFNLSTVRLIGCTGTAGTGFLIGQDILVTAAHVAEAKNCSDVATGKPLTTYHVDEENDFALMTGDLPFMPFARVSCEGYKKGHTYMSYGISSHFAPIQLFRASAQVATGIYTDKDFIVRGSDGAKAVPGMMFLLGNIVPGESGGPIVDDNAGVVGINNVSFGNFLGQPAGKTYSFELKNTILCGK